MCGYCSRELAIGLVGRRGSAELLDPGSTEARRIEPGDLLLFRDAEEARALGLGEVQPAGDPEP